MTDPFRLEGPAVISFSGGRTSGLMLRRILDAHGGALPPDVVAVFCNTGKEFPATLDFVRDCGERWGVPIVWLEYVGERNSVTPYFVEVSHATASRDGQPFEAMVHRRGEYLPNQVARFCTQSLKVLLVAEWAKARGWEVWTNAVGLRADEPARVGKTRARNGEERAAWVNVCPLYEAGVRVSDVAEFWRAQPFDLALRPGEGNCDLCFMKGWKQRVRIAQDHPETAAWWARMEREAKGTFRGRPPHYASIETFARRQVRLPMIQDDPEGGMPCACTD